MIFSENRRPLFRIMLESVSAFLRIAEPLYLFVFTQFRTQNRTALLLELL
jgi:hypothetical protein